MRSSVSAECYVQLELAVVAEMLPAVWRAHGVSVELEVAERPAAWTRRVEALRRSGTWRRGRAAGDVTVDLVPAGTDRTLVTLWLEPPSSALGRRLSSQAAWELCRVVRGSLRTDGVEVAAHVVDATPRQAEQLGGVDAPYI